MEKQITEPPKEAAFNAAIATLMRLNEILIDVKNNSIDDTRTKGKKQHYKYRLVKAFYVQSVPLIKEQEDKDLIKEKLSEIKLKTWYDKNLNPGSRQIRCVYSDDTENQLDDILILIQEALQKAGHFMPEKRDSGL